MDLARVQAGVMLTVKRLGGSLAPPELSARFQRNEVIARAEKERAIVDRWSGHAGFVERIRGGDREFCADRNYKDIPGFAGEEEMFSV